jgi:predicted RNase H-like HicB family nuclease
MFAYFWPCHVTRNSDGRFHVSPFDMVSCDGAGRTLEEASDRAREALQDYLIADPEIFLYAPNAFLEVDDPRADKVIRIEVQMPGPALN